MFKQKLANSKALRWGILLVVVLVLLVTTFVVVNAWLAPSHQVAAAPVFSTCAPGPAYGSSPAAPTSSRLLTPLCPPLIQSLGSWGG